MSRRSARVAKKRAEKDIPEEEVEKQTPEPVEEEQDENVEQAEADDGDVQEDEEADEEENVEYKDKLRETTPNPSAYTDDQELTNLTGDAKAVYENGTIVWAKYQDFPWWPGQVVKNETNRRGSRRSKRSSKTITIEWFGDFEENGECTLNNIIHWDPDEMDRIFVEVDEADTDDFQSAVDDANEVYLNICTEQGLEPLESAVKYDAKEWRKKKNIPTPKKKSKRKKKKADVEMEMQADADGVPQLEPLEGEEKNERRKSLRSSSRKKPPVKATVEKKGGKRKRGRPRKTPSTAKKRKITEVEKEVEEEPEEEPATKPNLRRSTRNKKKKDDEEEEAAVDGDEPKDKAAEIAEKCVAAYEAVSGTHSGDDFQDWVALFYYGMKQYSNGGDMEDDVISNVAKVFHLTNEKVFEYLSGFLENSIGKEPARKKRKM